MPDAPFRLSEADLPPDLDAVYAGVAAEVARSGRDVAAYKMGGSTATTRAAFGVTSPYFGPLYAGEVFGNGDTIQLRLAEHKAEPEIAMRVDATGAGIDAWALAVEFPSCPIENLMELGVRALIADRCAAGALVVGEPRALFDLPAQGTVRLSHGNDTLTTGALGALDAPPLDIAQACLADLAARGFPARPGQWIATGGLGPCVQVPSKATLHIVSDMGRLDMHLDLKPLA